MKRTLVTMVLSLLAAMVAMAQAPQQKPDTKPTADKPAEALPTVDQLLDKYVQALGGKAAIEKLTSRVVKGTFEIPAMGMSGPTEAYAKAPNKGFFVVDLAGFGQFKQGFNGTSGWALDPMQGMRDLSASEVAAAKRDDDFYKDIRLKELFTKLVVQGKAKVGEKDAYVVEATPADGKPEKYYFDVVTGLLLRSDKERDTPQGAMTIEEYLEDYREVDGVKIAFTMRQVTPIFTFSIKVTEVKHNVPIEDSMFNKPPSQ